MKERYYVLYPNGEIKIKEIKRDKMLEQMHEIIGCDCLEQVHTIIPNLVIIIDESGKIKKPPQDHNEEASLLYLGYLAGKDNIVGPAILANLKRIEPYGEQDLAPINDNQYDILTNTLGYGLQKAKTD